MGLIIWIVVGLIAGWAAGKIMKGSGYGVLGDIVLGILGGIVGGWVLGVLGLYSGGGLIPSIITAIIGAVLLVALVRMIKKA
ncbi:MAG: GlsB/YeaQ/YmgE family stress response membrane protein [Acidobacteria bacterium]|nr:GlsB/YeaQ/YmgE family stress response membrane protein [Acidobacteriota bacterium]